MYSQQHIIMESQTDPDANRTEQRIKRKTRELRGKRLEVVYRLLMAKEEPDSKKSSILLGW